MKFKVDKQTLDDLNILGKYKSNSIFSMFDGTKTKGGSKLLEQYFQEPLTDVVQINERSSLFQIFQQLEISFPFKSNEFEIVENYLSSASSSNGFISQLQTAGAKVMYLIGQRETYEQLNAGLQTTINLLRSLAPFLAQFNSHTISHPYSDKLKELHEIIHDSRLADILKNQIDHSLSFIQFVRCDHLLRQSFRAKLEVLLKSLYHIDVCIAVSNVSRSRNFSYAQALPTEEQCIKFEGLFHPGINKPVANDIAMHRSDNMLFLTGANMAGKSTFMKSVGIALYLGHMGFPIAARAMGFSVKDGIFTSINVPDNLAQGYSHFYAEVLRVKTVAEAVSRSENLLVIFDELFKGTNVKDAFDATLSVSTAFAKYRNCTFIVSTHIIEVGEDLKKNCQNVQFRYLPTLMEGRMPRYTYKMEEGITTDRHGMMIIENEQILDIIEHGITNN